MKVVVTATSVLLVAAGAFAGLLAYRYAQIDRVRLPDGVLDDEAHDEPQNFLLIGTDSRAFVEVAEEAAAYGTTDDVREERADTILVARTFPGDDRVALLSFPRDLWVPIAGTGGSNRINTAIQGGPQRLIETLNQFGIPIHHVVIIDFRGFKGLVNAVGGVDVYFPAPARDWDREKQISPTGLDIREAGCVRLDGDQALAYVRSRNFERLVDGVWHRDPTGDLNRITRQQDFLRRTLRRALSRGFDDPRRLNRVAASAVDFVQLDRQLGVGDLLRFGRDFRSLTPDRLETYSLPTEPGVTAGGADVLYLQEEPARPVLDVFRGVVDRPTVLLPGSVRLRVVDATGTRNTLAAVAYRLAAGGFVIADTGDAGTREPTTTIRYGRDQRGKAELVESSLVGRVELIADDELVGVDLVLTVGRDFVGVREVPVSPAAPAPGPPPAPPASEHPPSTPEC